MGSCFSGQDERTAYQDDIRCAPSCLDQRSREVPGNRDLARNVGSQIPWVGCSRIPCRGADEPLDHGRQCPEEPTMILVPGHPHHRGYPGPRKVDLQGRGNGSGRGGIVSGKAEAFAPF